MMSPKELDAYLHRETLQEQENLKGIFQDYSSLPWIVDAAGERCYTFFATSDRLRNAVSEKKVLNNYYNFAVIKQDRYADVPLHKHTWLELCYVYSGQCHMQIRNTKLKLAAGEMVLISPDAPHLIRKCGAEDIVVNFLITREYLNGAFFERLAGDNIVSEFFIDAINHKSLADSYIFFSAKKENRLAMFANQFLCEFFSPSVTSGAMLDAQMTLLICELVNVFQENMEMSNTVDRQLFAILKYLEKNYMNCTLVSTAAVFHMHPNYLSSYIKSHTGSTYKQLIQTQRLNQACALLRTTSMSTRDISIAVGYENTSFFFKKFTERYGCTPTEYRQAQSVSAAPATVGIL